MNTRDPMFNLFMATAVCLFAGIGLICMGEWLATVINSSTGPAGAAKITLVS